MASEEKAPSDRLYESGCTLCGNARWSAADPGLMNFGPCYDNPEGSSCSACWSAFGGNDGVDAEITRRKALRSPPSPPSEGEFYGTMPAELPEWLEPGATWTANRGSPDEYTFRLLSRAHNDGGWAAGCERWAVSGAYERIAPDHEHFDHPCGNIELDEVNWSTVRRLSAPSADKWEPKPGERVEWFDRGGHDEWFGATVSAVGSHATVLESDDGRTLRCPHGDRDLRPATPSPKAAERQLAIGRGATELGGSAAVKPDPYTTTRHGMNDAQVASAMAGRRPLVLPPEPRQPNAHDLRVAAWKAAHVEDLDRSTQSRLVALGGRYGKRVPAENRNWPEAEDD